MFDIRGKSETVTRYPEETEEGFFPHSFIDPIKRVFIKAGITMISI